VRTHHQCRASWGRYFPGSWVQTSCPDLWFWGFVRDLQDNWAKLSMREYWSEAHQLTHLY
jgi:hypothetical protein